MLLLCWEESDPTSTPYYTHPKQRYCEDDDTKETILCMPPCEVMENPDSDPRCVPKDETETKRRRLHRRQ